MKTNLGQQHWDEKVIELGGSILQSWAWGEFQQALGHKIYRFSGESYVNFVTELKLMLGKKYLYSSKGPLGDVQAALNDLQNFQADKTMVFARLEPALPIKLPKAVKDTQPTLNWLLDITKSEEEILAAMKPKHRYNINLAVKKGVIVKAGTKQDILEIWKLLLETAGKNKFRLHPQNYYWQMFEALSPDYLKIFLAQYQGQTLAGLFLAIFGDTAVFLHGGSSVINKEVMAPYALHWEAIKFARENGLKLYDFGGVAPIEDSQHTWAGVSRFKRGFGGFELAMPGAFDLVFSPLWYTVYKNARSIRKLF
jgi:peptidoglycan pentaglycine glycine transferase (the first glycine)